MIKGPVLDLAQENPGPSGMEECTFTSLRDIFTTLIDSKSRTGVLSPQRFLDIFKRNNEFFRNSMHQDAHEFYGIVLNDVIATVEANAKRMRQLEESKGKIDASEQAAETALARPDARVVTREPGTGWVHDIFEGVLTSETRCLTCETASQRDETFLDLSIDLEEHSSVTSCLQSFSAEEMLCERNKFHCDHCGGLQEAEKRMKVKKLPKVLALHLKRFKYTEDYSRLQKLFHRVVYPYHLRLFNTTDDAEDPDRMYELYAVVVHIGGNAYHGHYVAVIKTKDRGWLLFDDEMVEPVDKNFVRNFFGDKPGMACAYVLFYQETTFEKVREELDAEGVDQVKLATQAADLATTADVANGSSTALLTKLNSQPLPPVEENEKAVALDHTKSAPPEIEIVPPTGQLPPPPPAPLQNEGILAGAATPPVPPLPAEAVTAATAPPKTTKEEIARAKKEAKAREKAEEKARKAAEKEQVRLAAKERAEAVQKIRETTRLEREQLQQAIEESKQLAAEEEKRQKKDGVITDTTTATSSEAGGPEPEQNGTNHWNGFLNRAGRTSKSMSRKSMTRKSFAFLHIGGQNNSNNHTRKDDDKNGDAKPNHTPDNRPDRADTPSHSRDRGTSTSNGETSAAGAATATQNGTHHPPSPAPHTTLNQHNHHQNGTSTKSAHHTLLPWSTPRAETAPLSGSGTATPTEGHRLPDKDKLPLKERFSFGLGRKKSSRFLSSAS